MWIRFAYAGCAPHILRNWHLQNQYNYHNPSILLYVGFRERLTAICPYVFRGVVLCSALILIGYGFFFLNLALRMDQFQDLLAVAAFGVTVLALGVAMLIYVDTAKDLGEVCQFIKEIKSSGSKQIIIVDQGGDSSQTEPQKPINEISPKNDAQIIPEVQKLAHELAIFKLVAKKKSRHVKRR